jgi:diguanylate cyclase (GGDEF)-like protein/PAS domain S-box-containing protein
MSNYHSHHFYFRKSPVIRWSLAIIIFICAVVLRLTILPLNAGVIFITFYPATVICFYLCGIRAGLFIACLSGLTGYYCFGFPHFTFEYNYTALIASSTYFLFVTLIGFLTKKFQDNLLALKISEQRYFDILENQSEVICRFEMNGTMLYVNESFCRLFGKPKAELIGKKWFSLAFEDDVPFIKTELTKITPNNPTAMIETRIIAANSEIRWANFINKGFFNEQGNLIELQSIGCDITDKKLLEEQSEKIIEELSRLYYWDKKLQQTLQDLERLNVKQNLMLNTDLIGITKLTHSKFSWFNPAILTIFGYSKEELKHQSIGLLYQNYDDFLEFEKNTKVCFANRDIYRAQLKMRKRDGSVVWINVNGAMVSEEDNESLWIMDDVTDKKLYQDKIEQIAYHDILTGLPNRLLVYDRLNQAIAFAKRTEKMLAVCYLDLDGFKPVNDTFGHEAGDLLLKEISQRMQAAMRSCDTVGRLGGDEFVLLINELESQDEYKIVLDRLFNSIKLPVKLDENRHVSVGASIGIAFYPTDDTVADILLRYADEAMYKAKKGGRNQIYLYFKSFDTN